MRRREASAAEQEERVIPLVQEEIKIGKRTQVTGAVRVRKVVREEEAIVDEPLQTDEVTVKRLPVNEYIDRPRTIRQESGTTIIPVMEEVLEKRLLLREEIHITRKSSTVHRPRRVIVRKEEAFVERKKQGGERERSDEAAVKGGT